MKRSCCPKKGPSAFHQLVTGWSDCFPFQDPIFEDGSSANVPLRVLSVSSSHHRNVRFRCWFARGNSFHHVSLCLSLYVYIYLTSLFHRNPTKFQELKQSNTYHIPLWEHLWICSMLRSTELEEQSWRCQVGLYWLQWALFGLFSQ